MTINDKLRAVQKTDDYVERFEHILREREDEERWQKDRFGRFATMQSVMQNLKTNLITAAYPRGGGEHLRFREVLGVRGNLLPDFRGMDNYKSFQSLKTFAEDPQAKKIKDVAMKFEAPKRVEIKELELSLQQLVEFAELKTKRKERVQREIAFVIKDLTALYNLSNEGSP